MVTKKGVKKALKKDISEVEKAMKKDAKNVKKILKKSHLIIDSVEKPKKKSVKKPKKKSAKKPKKKQELYLKIEECLYCHNPIHELDHQVILTGCNDGKITDENYFHFLCWQENFNDAVLVKARQNVANIQKKVMGLMDNPLIKGLLSQVQGSNNLFSMFDASVEEEESENDIIKKVEEKIKNDRKRTAGKKA